MTIGIYAIINSKNGKIYIGKSKNVEHRFWVHKNQLSKVERDKKHCNPYLYSAVKKHGLDNFKFHIIEKFEIIDEYTIAARELYWMDFFKTVNPQYGYNLRYDSSTGMIAHPFTKLRLSLRNSGVLNGNYGNKWSDAKKNNMSRIAIERHASGLFYGDDWKTAISKASIKLWSDLEIRKKMAKAVSNSKKKYIFHQYDKRGLLMNTFSDMDEIITQNPNYKWQNIYAACSKYKPTYMGFIWEKELKK
jgi:group I intron endonuclease